MNIELQQILLSRYPKFLRKSGYSRPFDERGFECEDGWFNLINELCRNCEAEIESLMTQGCNESQWPCVSQIKEKFGCLRFRAVGAISGDLREKFLAAQEISLHTNESCGMPKIPGEQGVLNVLCESCQTNSAHIF